MIGHLPRKARKRQADEVTGGHRTQPMGASSNNP
jgi:hypothetical protein